MLTPTFIMAWYIQALQRRLLLSHSGQRPPHPILAPCLLTGPHSNPRMSMRSEDVYDYPSDYDAGDGAVKPSTTVVDNPELRESIKREMFATAATTNRGQLATQDEKDLMTDLVFQLEAMNPNPVTTDMALVAGTWELIYCDVQPFRSSPFFMTIGELFGEDREKAETAFALHRAATAPGEIGRVRQTITENELISEIDLKVGVLNGLPLELKTTVVSSASLQAISDESFALTATTTTVTNNNIFTFLNKAVEVPIDQILSSIRGSTPEVKLSTYFLDDNMRISRTPDEKLFVYLRTN
ncbi:unnamed protein product [Chrysoparadoxa australica]